MRDVSCAVILHQNRDNWFLFKRVVESWELLSLVLNSHHCWWKQLAVILPNSLKISAAVPDWMDSLVAADPKFHSRPAWLLVWKLSLILQNVKGVKKYIVGKK